MLGLFTAATALSAAPVLSKTVAKTGAKGMAKTMSGGSPAPYLTDPWAGPYGGVPAFDKVKIADFEPALLWAMDQQRVELKAITVNPAPADFANTIEALEKSGQAFGRVTSIYSIWDSNLSDKKFQAVSTKMSPVLAAYSDEIVQNGPLFARVEAVNKNQDGMNLTPEQKRLLWLNYRDFVRAGAKLNAADKKKVAAINKQLASHFDTFSKNLLHDEAQVTLIGKDDLSGLPDSFVASLAAKAKDMGHPGQYAVQNTRSAMEPFLTYSTNRPLREKIWRMYIMRGDNNDTFDNKKVCSEILKLRAERALLLGYPTHAHWRLEKAMAKTPDNALKLMMDVWAPAVNRVHEEVADMQKIADSEKAGITIAPWDYRYYAEKVRKSRYDLDDAAIKPYLQMDKIRDGIFWVAGRMYGFEFEPIHDIPTFHADMQTYKVLRNGELVGVWYFDPYAREGKNSGAWESEYQSQARFPNVRKVVVSNNCNFIKPEPGKPVLISWIDAETMFHEFGHAIHALSSNVTYGSLAGTSVATDFVEFPSQLNEHWLPIPEVLAKFAVHYQTGEAMPQALQTKIQNSLKFNQGFDTVEYLACAIVDMQYHLAGNVPVDIAAFEKDTLAKLNMPKEIVMRHRPTQFAHIFSSDDYSAGYYSYLWADALVADVYETFMKAGGPFAGDTAKRYFDTILSQGNTKDQAQQYRDFMGRDVDNAALMRIRGFA
ncbi:MAG: M3 family metallopeptidase [Asticcacaulis sp.]